ncbi:MAG TPA: hypothetical protein VFF73_33180 [Planctomycetota bacterium]|nr:hypothetical protein [Planctomycetota bacterium]
MRRTSRVIALTLLLLVCRPAHAQVSGRDLLDDPKAEATLNETTLGDLQRWKALLAESRVAIRHLDFTIAKNGHATRNKVSSDEIVQPGDEKYDKLRAKNEKLVSGLIARTERDIHAAKVQPLLDELPGAKDPLLADWFQGVVTGTKGKKLDLADAIHYYLKRRVTTKIALDIAEAPIKFKFYEPGDGPPANPKEGDVWLELGQPFPLIAAKAIELGSLALGSGKETPVRTANAVLRALHFLSVKKVPDGLGTSEDPLFTKGAELRSNPDELVKLISDRLGGMSKKDEARVEDKAYHHYTKHLPDEVLASTKTDGLTGRIVSSMVGNETALEKIKRLADARDVLFEKYGTPATVSTDELRAILDEAVRNASDPRVEEER